MHTCLLMSCCAGSSSVCRTPTSTSFSSAYLSRFCCSFSASKCCFRLDMPKFCTFCDCLSHFRGLIATFQVHGDTPDVLGLSPGHRLRKFRHPDSSFSLELQEHDHGEIIMCSSAGKHVLEALLTRCHEARLLARCFTIARQKQGIWPMKVTNFTV